MNPEQPTQTPINDTQTATTPPPLDTTPPAPQTPLKLPISKLGLWSFLITVVIVPSLYILGLLLGIVAGVFIFDENNTTKALSGFMSPVYGLLVAAFISNIALLAAMGLGVASLFVKNKRKIFGILGLVLATIALLFTFSVPTLIKSLFS